MTYPKSQMVDALVSHLPFYMLFFRLRKWRVAEFASLNHSVGSTTSVLHLLMVYEQGVTKSKGRHSSHKIHKENSSMNVYY